MKKLIAAFIFMVIFSPVLVSPVFAQDSGEMYYHNVTIEKIYLSGQGYVVQYRKGVNNLGTIGIPYEWFTAAGGKAEVLKLPPGLDWPSMSVFYKNGEFNYVRLYVHRSKAHWSWAVVPLGADVSKHFENLDDFKIDY
ncbi:MAG: hypothetical protein FWC19_09180 [Treponema sp.]|nr:hypothetical protein [Treponema sp.]MCL2272955.1 hypothetical protein [Treponema sp.]